MLAIASIALYVVGGSSVQSKEQLAAMQKQLDEAKKKAERLKRSSPQKTHAAGADAKNSPPAPWGGQDLH